ncbi:MAG: recombination-associated protein RdgC [Gammaproteobacteria bacterium]|nr:recombination-associated protein RdgC [Gammaproteobacteria bacterium]
MWFKNLQLYRLGQPFDLTPEAFEERLRADAFKGCNSMDMLTWGWAPPLGRHGQLLVHAANGYIMICARKEEKIIPAGVVKELLDDKVATIEAAEAREVYRREKMRMKEEIIVDLLPRALTRFSNLFAYIDVRNDLIIVDSASPAKAETLIGQLRNTLGRFPATPVKIKQSLSVLMTRWLNGEPLPSDFVLGGDCELKHPDPEGGVINCKHQDLEAGEIRNHIKNGKYAVKLALQWKERLSLVLHEDLSIKRLRFEDVIKEAENDADDPVSQFDLDYSLMVLELAEFFPHLLAALGGEDLPEDVPAKPVTAPPAREQTTSEQTPVEAEPA